MHAKVPFVAAASGLVKISSVGMFGVIFTPDCVSSGPPSQRVPDARPTSSAVPGPRSSSATRPSFVSFTARRASARVCLTQPVEPLPSSSVSRQNQRKSWASRRLPSSGDRSGYTCPAQKSVGQPAPVQRARMSRFARRNAFDCSAAREKSRPIFFGAIPSRYPGSLSPVIAARAADGFASSCMRRFAHGENAPSDSSRPLSRRARVTSGS